jgi:hypothetical protein
MRASPLLFAGSIVILSSTALAYNGPVAPDAPVESDGPRKVGFEFSLDGGGYYGGHGGDVRDSCSSGAQCHDEKALTGTRFGGRVGITLPEKRIGFDLDLGLWSGSSRTGRNTTLFGEQNVAVPVDFTDSVSWSGVGVGVGVHYDILVAPVVVSAGLTFGYLSLKAEVGREGTITTDSGVVPVNPNTPPLPSVSTSAYYAAPELRVAVPLPANIRIGVAIGALISSGFEVRPDQLIKAGSCGATSCTYGGKPIGFIPQANATPENQMDHLYLLRGSLFASIGF